MAAFDTAITPAFSTPANTSNATLFTAGADTAVLVDVVNLTTVELSVRVGVTPSGGAVHWKLFDQVIPSANSVLGIGPLFLQSGDAVIVRTDNADDATFSLTGVEST